ncbi:MAG: diiron oxygenase [Bdellovibrionales bacterium]
MNLAKLAANLCKVSEEQPLDLKRELHWPDKIDLKQWSMSPELISLYGTETFEQLSEEQQMKLSFFEAVNFFSLNIHGERHLMSGMAKLLYSPEMKDYTPYLHHFLAEENNHSTYFGMFCYRYADKVYPDMNSDGLPREYKKGEQEFLYFAKVMLFEECFDRYNVKMASDNRLPEIVRDINRCHHIDESRHLAFGRQLIKELFERYSPQWGDATLENVRAHIVAYMDSFWRDLFNFRAYKDAGIPNPIEVRDAALESAQGTRHYQELTKAVSAYFIKTGILNSEPSTSKAAG